MLVAQRNDSMVYCTEERTTPAGTTPQARSQWTCALVRMGRQRTWGVLRQHGVSLA